VTVLLPFKVEHDGQATPADEFKAGISAQFRRGVNIGPASLGPVR
jgi:hypothetical protein